MHDPDDLGRPVLAAGGDDHLPGAVALPPQEVAGGRRGATCQSSPPLPRAPGER